MYMCVYVGKLLTQKVSLAPASGTEMSKVPGLGGLVTQICVHMYIYIYEYIYIYIYVDTLLLLASHH